MPGHRVHRFGVIILPTAAIAALLISNITNPQQHVSGAAQEKPTATRQDWPIYGGDANGDRYSPLSQIDRKNVKQLHVAWRVDVGTVPSSTRHHLAHSDTGCRLAVAVRVCLLLVIGR